MAWYTIYMLRFDVITIFPEVFSPYTGASILGRAQREKHIAVNAHNLRSWTDDAHRTVDDKPFGGGAGMVMQVEPIFKAVQELASKQQRLPKRKNAPSWLPKRKKQRVILFSAAGKQFTQRDAERLGRYYEHLIFICGRYEGVDARVAEHIADEELSIGPYVLTGGELPAMVVIDAVTRLLPGVIEKESLREESFSFSAARGSKTNAGLAGLLGEYPHYTRPAIFYPSPRNKRIAWRVPEVLLSGDHEKIAAWRRAQRKRLRY